MHAFVCTDTNGGGVWRFDKEHQRYFRVQMENDTISAIIDGKFLPDPNALWQNRVDQIDVARFSDIGQKMKPQPATWALWEHWKKVQDAHTKH